MDAYVPAHEGKDFILGVVFVIIPLVALAIYVATLSPECTVFGQCASSLEGASERIAALRANHL